MFRLLLFVNPDAVIFSRLAFGIDKNSEHLTPLGFCAAAE